MTGSPAITTKRAAEAAQKNPCVAAAAKEAYRIVVLRNYGCHDARSLASTQI
jgi:hypothetical protein